LAGWQYGFVVRTEESDLNVAIIGEEEFEGSCRCGDDTSAVWSSFAKLCMV